jgi:hypothetical protein
MTQINGKTVQKKKKSLARCQWLTPITPAIWKGRNEVLGQTKQTIHKTLRPYLKNSHSKMDWRHCSNSRASALQSCSPKFKPQSPQKKIWIQINFQYKFSYHARHQWLTPIILATQEAEIRRITVRSQPRQIVPSRKKTSQKRAGGMAQDVGPKFKP